MRRESSSWMTRPEKRPQKTSEIQPDSRTYRATLLERASIRPGLFIIGERFMLPPIQRQPWCYAPSSQSGLSGEANRKDSTSKIDAVASRNRRKLTLKQIACGVVDRRAFIATKLATETGDLAPPIG